MSLQTDPSPSQQQQQQQQQQSRVAAEPEPRVLCGLPIGGAVGILGSILMICQIFGLFYLSPFMLYFFEISIGSAMMFILSTGAKHRKIAYVTAYMLYISMYTFWVFFLILGAVLATIYLVDNNDNICTSTDGGATTAKGCLPQKFTTGDVEMVIISCFFLTVSIIVAIVQMRYLMILYNFLRRNAYRLPSHNANNYNVQYIVPTPISPSGMPPPPRYTAHAAPMPNQPGPTTKAPLPEDNETTNNGNRTVSVNSTPILTVTNPTEPSGTDNLAFGDDDLSRSRAPSRPPAYSDVVEPGHITIRTDALS